MIFGDGRLAGSAKALPTTYSCASGETSPPETAGGSRRRLTAKRRRLILPTYVNRICHDYTRGSGWHASGMTANHAKEAWSDDDAARLRRMADAAPRLEN